MPKTKNTCQTIKLNDNRKEDVRERGSMKMGKGCEKVQGEENMTSVNHSKFRGSTQQREAWQVEGKQIVCCWESV